MSVHTYVELHTEKDADIECVHVSQISWREVFSLRLDGTPVLATRDQLYQIRNAIGACLAATEVTPRCRPRRPCRRAIAAVLYDRPYLRWDLVPVAAYLWGRGYFGARRDRVVDSLADGESSDRLVMLGWLSPADAAGCRRLLPRTQVA